MTAAVWFTLAGLALLGGLGLLALDRWRSSARGRARREWAQAQQRRYTSADPVITGQFGHGVFASGGAGRAVDLVAGSRGASELLVFDLQRQGRLVATVVALRRPTDSATTLELRLGSTFARTEAGSDLLGPVGSRFAFTSDLESARRAVDQRMVELADSAGDDVSVLWGEGSWALAALDTGSGPERWEATTEVLARFADLLRLLPPAR